MAQTPIADECAVSVVVCTFNRAALLDATLTALLGQIAPDVSFEIIVVDNNSTDDTKDVTLRASAHGGPPIRYVHEPVQGLSHARNTGIRAAQGALVAFVDDDVDIDRHWLSELCGAFVDARVMCAGGPIRPIWPHARPAWLTEQWEGFLSISEFEPARETGVFRDPTYPWGANICFRKSIFDAIGLFPTDLGRVASELLSNEEISVCRRIEEAGHVIRFVPGAIVFHKIHKERLTRHAFYHRTYAQGRSDAILDRGQPRMVWQRLKTMSAASFWTRIDSQGTAFDRACAERLFMGYLAELTGIHDAPVDSRFSRIRALRTTLRTILSTSAQLATEHRRQATYLEALVHQRDGWIATHGTMTAELTTDRDNWRRVAEERSAERDSVAAGLTTDRDNWRRVAEERSAERDSVVTELATDRDNWRRVAEERQRELAELTADRERWTGIVADFEGRALAAEHALERTSGARWVRMGLRLGLLDVNALRPNVR